MNRNAPSLPVVTLEVCASRAKERVAAGTPFPVDQETTRPSNEPFVAESSCSADPSARRSGALGPAAVIGARGAAELPVGMDETPFGLVASAPSRRDRVIQTTSPAA